MRTVDDATSSKVPFRSDVFIAIATRVVQDRPRSLLQHRTMLDSSRTSSKGDRHDQQPNATT